MSTMLIAPKRSSWFRAKYLLFAAIGLMLAYVFLHDENFLVHPKDPIWQHYEPFKWWLLPHGIAGACALLLGPMQFSDRLRDRFRQLHRVAGRIYVAGVFVAAPLGFYIQYFQERMGDPRSFSIAAAVNAALWMITTGIALVFVLRGKVQEHRQWMTRSFAVALVFLEARVIGGVGGWENLDVHANETIVWVCLVFSILSADLALQWQKLGRLPSVVRRHSPASPQRTLEATVGQHVLAEAGNRWVLGGAWDDPIYMFVDPDAQSPWLRAPNIGFRTVKYIDSKSVPTLAFAPVPSPRRDFSKVKPPSDQLFQAYRSIYSYDKGPLNASVEEVGDEDDWKVEKATYAAGYGNERAIAYLFLPKKAKSPYQAVLFFPGSNALLLRKFALYPTAALDAVLRSGRAVIYPIYKSTYERGDGMETDVPDTSSNWRDHVVMWVKDTSRALDYVDSRPDLDHTKIGYYGYSWGAVMGAIIPAVDSRIKVNVLALGGMEYGHSLPEVDKINFLPRVTQPTLMLNGHYDFFFPVDSTQIPFYNLLGAKKDQKKRIQYETGHNIPRNELIKETLNWFDLWLGPVQ